MQHEERLEDQGEWERCRSFRRMFLSLNDSQRDRDLNEIAKQLICLAETHRPDDPGTKKAAHCLAHGLRDPKNDKELAERVYVVMRYVLESFDRMPHQRWAGGGEAVVVEMVRRVVPLAPPGFRHAGRLEGTSSSSGLSVNCESRRIFAPGRRR